MTNHKSLGIYNRSALYFDSRRALSAAERFEVISTTERASQTTLTAAIDDSCAF